MFPLPRLLASALALSTVACEDSSKPAQPGSEALQLRVAYICDNDFILQSGSTAPLTVKYQVLGGDERGELSLPARASDGTLSSTYLTTLTRGPLQVSSNAEEMAAVPNSAANCPPSTVEPQSRVGQWSAPFPWRVVAVHLHLLPNGKVLSWGRVGPPQ